MSEISCKYCKFWKEDNRSMQIGTCRVNPPTHEYGFPRVNQGEWCSRWEDKFPEKLEPVLET